MYEVYAGFLKEDITLTIDGQRVSCPPESSILEAARLNNIEIPTLCYLKGLTATGACGICAVEIIEDGKPVIRRACRYRAKQREKIVLDQAVTADKLKVTVTD